TFSHEDASDIDTLAIATASAIVHGARFDVDRIFGPPPASEWRHLPHYAWQRVPLMSAETTEALGGVETGPGDVAAGGLIGHRVAGDVTVWHSHLDTAVRPELDDHSVAGQPWFPAAAFVDMAVAAAQAWFGKARVELRDLDIVRPLVLSKHTTMDVRTRLDPETGTCEIASRPRLSDDTWHVHARCRVAALSGR